jgi:hypothetical protein
VGAGEAPELGEYTSAHRADTAFLGAPGGRRRKSREKRSRPETGLAERWDDRVSRGREWLGDARERSRRWSGRAPSSPRLRTCAHRLCTPCGRRDGARPPAPPGGILIAPDAAGTVGLLVPLTRRASSLGGAGWSSRRGSRGASSLGLPGSRAIRASCVYSNVVSAALAVEPKCAAPERGPSDRRSRRR